MWAIGAGPGNPPAVVDETAHLEVADVLVDSIQQVSNLLQARDLRNPIVVTDENVAALIEAAEDGKRFGSELEIVSGIADGETVIRDGVAQLRDGQPVQIKP